MPDGTIDPASLDGDALTRWYLRSPEEINQERQAAAAQRYREFFGGDLYYDPDPGFDRGLPAGSQDVDPGFSRGFETQDKDIDPGFSWVPAGANRWRSTSPSPDASFFAPTRSSTAATSTEMLDRHGTGADDGGRLLLASTNPVQAPVGAPARGLSNTQPVAQRSVSAPVYRSPATPPLPSFISSLFGGPVPLTSPEGNIVGYYDHQAAKAGLGLTAEYSEIAPLFHPGGWLDSVLTDGAATAANIGAQSIKSRLASAPLSFPEQELWQGKSAAGQIAPRLTEAAKSALRAAARVRYAQANGISASDMGAVVHHSEGLEYAHLKPDADPNRLANLWGLLPEAHAIANKEAAAFRAALNGRIPTQAEVMAVKLKIDRMVAPYLQRAGVSRPGPRPK